MLTSPVSDYPFPKYNRTLTLKPAKPNREYLFDYLSYLVKKNGPSKKDYHELNEWIIEMSNWTGSPEWDQDLQSRFLSTWGEAISTKTIQGFIFHKPHGYAGDFEVLDKLYTNHLCADSRYQRWDEFLQSQAGAAAVRNRKKYIRNIITKKLSRTNKPINILNIGSGSGRDMFDIFTAIGDESNRIHFVCIEQDQDAIDFASRLCEKFIDRISFHKVNVIKYNQNIQHDIVWAAGIFDYFSDRLFCRMLKKMLYFTKPGGEIIVGNFSNTNPTRFYMRLVRWFLHSRSSQQLYSLAQSCGISRINMKVKREKTGVNLFLHIQNKKKA
ncbi:MAG: methyltransferase domain-containing protein [Spirochaetales bacterium]|nr:methyltransferase domain-containing protein [Spirochaetales bacterium]